MSELGTAFGETLDRVLKEHNEKHPPSSGPGTEWNESLWHQISELGLPLLMVDEAQSGAGGTADDLFDVLAVTGRHGAPAPSCEPVLSAWLLARHEIASPAGLVSLAVDPELSVAQDSDGLTISGTLHDVAWGRSAHHVVVVFEARCMVINISGATVQNEINLAGEPSDVVTLENHKIANDAFANAVVSVEGVRRMAALGRAAQMCGAMHEVLNMTMQYVSDREQFGRPLKKFQAMQHHLAIMYSDVVAATTATRGALGLENPAEAAFESAAAIIRTREAATRIAATSHQAHGAIGFTADFQLGRLTKRLWAWRDEYGSEKSWKEALGELVLSNSETSLWERLTDGSG